MRAVTITPGEVKRIMDLRFKKYIIFSYLHNLVRSSLCSFLQLFIFLFLPPLLTVIFYISIGYTDVIPPHNTTQERSVTSAHYRRAGVIEFKSWVDSSEFRSKKIDRAAIKERVLRYNKLTEKQAKEFSQSLPPLPQCDRSQTLINKDQIKSLSRNGKFQIDLLFYAPRDGETRSAAEMWFGEVVAYEPESPTTKSRLGNLLGLKCLPTRIVLTNKGLEFRTAESALKVRAKDADQRGKIFQREIKQVRKDFAYKDK